MPRVSSSSAYEDAGILRMTGFGDDGLPCNLVPLGAHSFALGHYERARLARVYRPDDRVDFVVDGQRVTGFVDRSTAGHVYGRAVRLR